MSDTEENKKGQITIEINKSCCNVVYTLGKNVIRLQTIEFPEKDSVTNNIKELLNKVAEKIDKDMIAKNDYIYVPFDNDRFMVCKVERIMIMPSSEHSDGLCSYFGYWSELIDSLPKTVEEFDKLPKREEMQSAEDSDVCKLKLLTSQSENVEDDDFDERLSDI